MPDSWTDLFDRASAYEVDEQTVIDTLHRRRADGESDE